MAACLPLQASPRDLFERAAWPAPHVLLESARPHPVTGRYSILAGQPSRALTAQGNRIRLEGPGLVRSLEADPLAVLEDLLRSKAVVRLPGLPPFPGGAVGFFSYDAVRLLEELPSLAQDDLGLPEVVFLFFDQAVVVDHAEERVWAIALADPSDGERAYDEAVGRVETLTQRLTRSWDRGSCLSAACLPDRQGETGIVNRWKNPPSTIHQPPSVRSTHTRLEFERMVRRAKAYIAEGEIYQANLSQRLSMPLIDSPWSLYRRLTEINPSPFAAYADLGFLQIVSASPERFLRVRGREVETRPIAGTRPRGETSLETARLRRELILNEKERAEHLMLVDLERNDLGRICRYGSVEVNDLMTLEEYSHVIHIVSNVRGILKEGVGLRDLLAATFPGGTISGCPKIRCLEIIEELEPVRRHLYTGALGYLSTTGDLDLNLLIRTAFIREGWVHVQVGAGIVADSDPAREYEETLHKAQALLEVISVRPELVEGRTPVHASTGSA